jgi:hypothetical protein
MPPQAKLCIALDFLLSRGLTCSAHGTPGFQQIFMIDRVQVCSPPRPGLKTCNDVILFLSLSLWLQVYSAQDVPARAEIGLADVMQAIQARETLSFVQPPSQDVSV